MSEKLIHEICDSIKQIVADNGTTILSDVEVLKYALLGTHDPLDQLKLKLIEVVEKFYLNRLRWRNIQEFDLGPLNQNQFDLMVNLLHQTTHEIFNDANYQVSWNQV